MLLNLLINARQAMPSGGRLWIKLLYDAENDMIDLVVRDNGCGIPADKLPRIFESFYTTKSGPDASGKGGTGLGLSMCRDIIESHHGRIRVDSRVGKGTAFTLKLPTAAKAARRNARPSARRWACPSAQRTQPAVSGDHALLVTNFGTSPAVPLLFAMVSLQAGGREFSAFARIFYATAAVFAEYREKVGSRNTKAATSPLQ